MKSEALEVATASVASKATYAGSGATIAGVLSANEFVALAGLAVAVFSALVNWYYKHKADRREERELRARIDRLGPFRVSGEDD